MRVTRLVSAALLLALTALAANAQFVPGTKVGVFPGRLPPDIAAPPPPPPTSLQPPWQQAVVGSGMGGEATSSSNVLTDSCKGAVGYTADSGNFVYQSISGDFEMTGQLQSIVSDEVWSRNVPVVRQSTAAGSKYAGLFFDHRGNFAFNWRTTLDAHNDWVGYDTAYTEPQWWHITRAGNVFSGYTGLTSTGPWTLDGSTSITMSDPVDAGVLCENGNSATPAVEVSSLPIINSLAAGAGILQFTTSSQSVNENVGTVLISVSRVAGSSGAVSAIVSRDSQSSAALTTDYTTNCTFPCTLNWSNADAATKVITLTIVNRSGSQASRHLDLSLGSAGGGASLGSPGAEVVTINDVNTGGQTKWNPGYYTDCYAWMPHGGDFNHFIGSDAYNAFRSCIDWSATQSGVTGVFLPVFWGSMEGDTAGSYDGTVGNGLASAGKMGFALFDDMLSYAASKSMKVIFELDWFNYYSDPNCALSQPDNSPQAAYYIRGLLPKYLLAPACGGTDGSNVYSGGYRSPGFDGQSDTIYIKLWKSAVMDRWIALMNAYAARYDSNPALEMWLMFGEEGDTAGVGIPQGEDGYTWASIGAQFQRIVSEVKPNWPHTNIEFQNAWDRGAEAQLAEAVTSAAKATGTSANNATANDTTFGEAAYLGLVDPNQWSNTTMHDYRGQLPYSVWQATDLEVCPGQRWYLTPQQFYDTYMTNGKPTSSGHPLRPSHVILSAYAIGNGYCASANVWGAIGGTGWYNFIQTHQLNTACPTVWTGGCTSGGGVVGTPGTVQFFGSAQSITESVGTATVTVTRASGTTGAASVQIARSGTSTAVGGTDYTNPGGGFPVTLNWAAGDGASKTLTLTITNRAGTQGSRHLDLALQSATGATIGSPSADVITIQDAVTSAQTRWHPGIYGDCFTEQPHGGDALIAIGLAEYTATKACIDYWSAQTPEAKGVYIACAWSCFEGDTPGDYAGVVGNALGGPGRIGHPLWDDLLSYAQSKGLKVIVAFEWFNYGSGPCGSGAPPGYGPEAWTPRYLFQPGCGGGTDVAGTYGVYCTNAFPTCTPLYYQLWKAAVMNRWIAMIQDFGTRYDSNTALEGVIIQTQEGECFDYYGVCGGGAIEAQQARYTAEVKPYYAHSNVMFAIEWGNPSYLAPFWTDAISSASKAVGYHQNDHVPDSTGAGAATFMGYTGACSGSAAPCWGNVSTHNFRNQLPVSLQTATEMCGMAAVGRNYPYYTPQQFYDAEYTSGNFDTGQALGANFYLFSRTFGQGYCPNSPDQQWGTNSSGGWKQFMLTHTMNTTCPSAYTGGCDTTP